MAPTHHATAVLVGAAGVLIRGPSGAGKSSLALALIEETAALGGFAALVADDRVHLEACHGRLLARTPPDLAGLIERRGFGLQRLSYEPAAVIKLVVDFQAPERVPRLPEPDDRTTTILDVGLPRLALGIGWPGAASAVRAALLAASAEAGSAPACA